MKATGVVRRIDDLGRVVIPKEIRKTKREDSTLYYPMDKFAGIFFPAAKNLLTK